MQNWKNDINQLNDNFHKLQKLEFALQAKQVHALAQDICFHDAFAVMDTVTG